MAGLVAGGGNFGQGAGAHPGTPGMQVNAAAMIGQMPGLSPHTGGIAVNPHLASNAMEINYYDDVPEGWTKHWSGTYQRYYYFNAKTGEQNWKPAPSSATSEIRRTAELWAQTQGFASNQHQEFGHLMKMALQRYIPKTILKDWTQIDNGSFGRIFRCTYEGREVAVKEVGQSKDGQSALKTRMRELVLELLVLVQVKHPNLVEFLGTAVDFPSSFSHPPSINMVFSMCSRGSLHRVLFGSDSEPSRQNSRPQILSAGQKIKIGKQVASGLEYLHSKRVIHRDLNTRNVLLCNDFTAKIADFGCARILPETGRLRTTTVLGSPAYMSPEQMRGDELTSAVDAWALGLLLWEMMTDSKPWEGQYHDFNALSAAVLRGARVPMPISTSQYPSRFVEIIKASQRTLPHERPTAETMHYQLEIALQELPTSSAQAEDKAKPSVWSRLMCIAPRFNP